MARSVACYEGFCIDDSENRSNIGTYIVLGALLVVALGAALYSNASLIGTEILTNPFFTVL